MITLKARPLVGGRAEGTALVTAMPMNFTAAFTKPRNLLPWCRSLIQDRHHELHGRDLRGAVLVYPATIGSTYTGMILLELLVQGVGPAAIIVGRADPLMTAGPLLAEVWFDRGVPVVEVPGVDADGRLRTGQRVLVDGDAGEVCLLDAPAVGGRRRRGG